MYIEGELEENKSKYIIFYVMLYSHSIYRIDIKSQKNCVFTKQKDREYVENVITFETNKKNNAIAHCVVVVNINIKQKNIVCV